MYYFLVISYKMCTSLMCEYCVNVERMNGTFTLCGLDVVLSVDSGMVSYSYIAQSMA